MELGLTDDDLRLRIRLHRFHLVVGEIFEAMVLQFGIGALCATLS